MARGRTWTSDETARLRRLTAAGWTDSRIAEEMGFARETIVRKRLDLNIKPGQNPLLTAMIARLNVRRWHRRLA